MAQVSYGKNARFVFTELPDEHKGRVYDIGRGSWCIFMKIEADCTTRQRALLVTRLNDMYREASRSNPAATATRISNLRTMLEKDNLPTTFLSDFRLTGEFAFTSPRSVRYGLSSTEANSDGGVYERSYVAGTVAEADEYLDEAEEDNEGPIQRLIQVQEEAERQEARDDRGQPHVERYVV